MQNAGMEISWEEYLCLLDTAKGLNDERTYLLVKVFASTGVSVMGLQEMTVGVVGMWVLKAANDIVRGALEWTYSVCHMERTVMQRNTGIQISAQSR